MVPDAGAAVAVRVPSVVAAPSGSVEEEQLADDHEAQVLQALAVIEAQCERIRLEGDGEEGTVDAS